MASLKCFLASGVTLFLLPTSPGQDSLNPKGIPSISPGLRAARYPGFGGGDEHNPERVASPAVSVARKGCNPVGVEDLVSAHSQGSSPTRNPGLNDAIPLGLAEKQPGLAGNRKVTLALLVFLPSLVHAQSSVVWKTNYYAVGGATLREIHESFRQARPWKNKSSYDGQTDWRIDWRFQVTTVGQSCRCDSFTTQTAITITLPRWTAPTNAPPEVRNAWISFFTALSKHEAGHAQNAQAAVNEMHQRVNRLPTETDCTVLKKRIDETAGSVVAKFRRRDDEFDRQTGHGVREGAFLPRGRRDEFSRREPGFGPRHQPIQD